VQHNNDVITGVKLSGVRICCLYSEELYTKTAHNKVTRTHRIQNPYNVNGCYWNTCKFVFTIAYTVCG